MNPKINSWVLYTPVISVAFLITGLILLVFMMITESELGLFPLVMTATGGLGYFLYKIKFKHTK